MTPEDELILNRKLIVELKAKVEDLTTKLAMQFSAREVLDAALLVTTEFSVPGPWVPTINFNGSILRGVVDGKDWSVEPIKRTIYGTAPARIEGGSYRLLAALIKAQVGR